MKKYVHVWKHCAACDGQSARYSTSSAFPNVIANFKSRKNTHTAITHDTCILIPDYVGRDSLVGIATRYGLDGMGIESRWGRDFPHPSSRPWGPPSLLLNGYRVFPGSKAGGALTTYPHAAPRLKSRTIPFLPLWAFLACSRVNFPFYDVWLKCQSCNIIIMSIKYTLQLVTVFFLLQIFYVL